jgi:hypothetical protein
MLQQAHNLPHMIIVGVCMLENSTNIVHMFTCGGDVQHTYTHPHAHTCVGWKYTTSTQSSLSLECMIRSHVNCLLPLWVKVAWLVECLSSNSWGECSNPSTVHVLSSLSQVPQASEWERDWPWDNAEGMHDELSKKSMIAWWTNWKLQYSLVFFSSVQFLCICMYRHMNIP